MGRRRSERHFMQVFTDVRMEIALPPAVENVTLDCKVGTEVES